MTRHAPGRHACSRPAWTARAVASPAGAAALGALTVAGLLGAGTAQAQAAVPVGARPPVLGTAGSTPVASPPTLPAAFAASRQLITVQATGSDAVVTAWQLVGARWVSEFSTTAARIGAHGITDGAARVQNTGTTPSGVFTLTQGFGVGANPGTKMPYHKVTSTDWWVEDPTSAYYNQMRSSTLGGFHLTESGANGSEHLINYPTQYHNALVVNFNMNPAVHGRGAGIFLHDLGPQAGPTAGCVALPAAVMTRVMKWIDPAQHPVISIAPAVHRTALARTAAWSPAGWTPASRTVAWSAAG
ncbi:L,D-transpeptidase family protein [Streptacidiphilus cavernicola]|uniref:L,D-transpeptidase n=1 Tax=Streptacidiphilus cavernicola TaxID=3342716 RepID=A0ABV6W0T5_9ACTN